MESGEEEVTDNVIKSVPVANTSNQIDQVDQGMQGLGKPDKKDEPPEPEVSEDTASSTDDSTATIPRQLKKEMQMVVRIVKERKLMLLKK